MDSVDPGQLIAFFVIACYILVRITFILDKNIEDDPQNSKIVKTDG